jgi:hypothetical protein
MEVFSALSEDQMIADSPTAMVGNKSAPSPINSPLFLLRNLGTF